MTAPTSLRGAFDPGGYSQSLLYDALETVPDLQPGLLATRTYAAMRRDSRLAAIVGGYTLQIRRASWQLEPGGCRPEVVQLVADDMGLPVAGDDKPGAARTRGVSWNDHLRTALLELPFGFSSFELLAEIVDGRARLTALAPRLPATVELIHADPKTGALLGISQELLGGRDDKPQIKADRLAHYAHDPEGTWSGTSLLRSSYAPWFLKQELMRVHATSARRFGMGVPTVEWAQGSTPTPLQVAEAQQLASAARVGETSGASLPPGASLVLRGLVGAVPDVLQYIKFLNTEMAAAALMPHLDLGISESGSRATATAFLESWMLALGSVAEEIADVATRQVAARIVGWNWENEQVPRVVAAGIGAQRDVTAESLQLLLASGALSPDPGLEAWVRREYRLPAREGMAQPAPSVAGDTVAAANPRKPRKRKTAAAQLELPIAAATPEPDFGQIQQDWETAKADLLEQWPDLADPIVAALVSAAGTAVAGGALAALGSLTVDAVTLAAVTTALADAMATLADKAAGHAHAELAALGKSVDGSPDRARIDAFAAAFAGQIAAGYAQAAGRKALAMAGITAFDADLTAYLEEIGTSEAGLVADTFGAALSAGQMAGRAAVLAEALGVQWVADETLDSNTCANCLAADGRVYKTWAEAEADYPIAGNFSCLGSGRCRGQLRVQPAT